MGPPEAAAEEAAREDEIFAEINITPLTDVILVLLIIFMVSSSAMVDAARDGRLDIALPRAGSAATPDREDPAMVIGLAADGRLFVRGKQVSDAGLRQALEQTIKQHPQTVVIVDADGALPHRAVVAVIDRVRAAGFTAVGIGAETSAP